jgi:RNA polymerase sigma-70 factor (ECF subfamily)
VNRPLTGETLRRARAATHEIARVSPDADKTQRFREMALPHLDDVYSLARYLLGNGSDAEDAVQECCLRAFRHFDGFRGGAIKPWLLAILRNVCRAEYARRAGVVVGLGGEAGEPPDDIAPLWNEAREAPDTRALHRLDAETMRRLIADLSPEFREVIVLREINDLSYRDIAQVIDAPVGTVMSRLARARSLLREAWIATEKEGSPA